MSLELIQRTDDILKSLEIPDRSTFFQLKNFVLGKEPTVHGQIWATIRNLQDRRDAIDSLELQIEDSEDNIELLDIDIDNWKQTGKHSLTERQVEIEIRKRERQKKSLTINTNKLKNKIRYIMEEINYLVGAFEVLVKAAGGVKPLDDPELQRNYWNEKLTEELNLCFLLKKQVNTDLVQTILALDNDMPVKKQMLQILQKVQTQMIEERDRQLTEASVGAK